jgi:hypothetical protein
MEPMTIITVSHQSSSSQTELERTAGGLAVSEAYEARVEAESAILLRLGASSTNASLPFLSPSLKPRVVVRGYFIT